MGEEFSQPLVKPYNNNTLQEENEGVRMNLLIASSISSMYLLPTSEFCRIHPLVANLFPITIKQNRQSETFCKELVKTDKQSYDTRYSKRLQNPFYFAAKSIKTTKLCELTKEASDLVDQKVQDMLRKSAIGASGRSNPRRTYFSDLCFLRTRKMGGIPSSQPKVLEQKCSVSALQDRRVAPIKGNVVTRGQNV